MSGMLFGVWILALVKLILCWKTWPIAERNIAIVVLSTTLLGGLYLTLAFEQVKQ